MSKLPAAVLWDLDGTLLDTEPYWLAAETELVANFGGTWTAADALSVVGSELKFTATQMQNRGVKLPWEEIVEQLLDRVIAGISKELRLRPGALELLQDLRQNQVPCALVTMSWQRLVDPVLEKLGAGFFHTVITGDQVNQGKPAPEPYLLGLAALNVTADNCVAIEDSPTGVASAVAAGIPTLAVINQLDFDPPPGAVKLKTLTEVAALQLTDYFKGQQ